MITLKRENKKLVLLIMSKAIVITERAEQK